MIRMDYWFRKKDHRVVESFSALHIQGTAIKWFITNEGDFDHMACRGPHCRCLSAPTLLLGPQFLGVPSREEWSVLQPWESSSCRIHWGSCTGGMHPFQWMHSFHHLPCQYRFQIFILHFALYSNIISFCCPNYSNLAQVAFPFDLCPLDYCCGCFLSGTTW